MKKIVCIPVFFLMLASVSVGDDHDYDHYMHDYYKYGNFWVYHPLYGPQYNRYVPMLSYPYLPYHDNYLRRQYKYWNRYYEHPLYGPQYNRGMEGPFDSDYNTHPNYPLIPLEKEESFYDRYRRNPDTVRTWTDEEIQKYNQEIDEARRKEQIEEDEEQD